MKPPETTSLAVGRPRPTESGEAGQPLLYLGPVGEVEVPSGVWLRVAERERIGWKFRAGRRLSRRRTRSLRDPP
jgi:hypothetical protein